MDQSENPSNELSLKEIILKAKDWKRYLFSHTKILILAIILGAILGFGYAFFKKPTYQATLTFALEDEKSSGGMGNALGLVNSLGFNLGSDGSGIFSGSNLAFLFTSRLMVEQTLLTPVKIKGKEISLAEMYLSEKKWRNKWDNKPELKGIEFKPFSNRSTFTRAQDSILGKIYLDLYKNDLSVSQKDEKVAVLSVEVLSTNEEFAKYFAESLSENVSNFYIQTKSKKAKINMDILKKQTDSVRAVLGSSITSAAAANDEVFALNPAMNVKRAPSNRKQVDVQANTVILTELVKQTELAKVNLRKETPLIQIIDKPILPLPKNSLNKVLGLVLGGAIAGFLCVFVLIFKRIFNEI